MFYHRYILTNLRIFLFYNFTLSLILNLITKSKEKYVVGQLFDSRKEQTRQKGLDFRPVFLKTLRQKSLTFLV